MKITKKSDLTSRYLHEIGFGLGLKLVKSHIDLNNANISVMSALNEGSTFTIELQLGDSENLQFDNETFDFIVSSNMIHHVPYPILFFKEMNRILKPGGEINYSRD